MKRTGLFLAIMLVVVTNLALLAGVWYNRTGSPDAVITLTERELPLVQMQEDDSGIALRIDYRRTEHGEEGTWLDRAKLEELGFECPEGEVARNLFSIRKLFLVLKLEEEAENMESRLVTVDAGRDADELRSSYNDRSRYIIAPGVIRLFLNRDEKEEDRLDAHGQNLLTSIIHVPKQHSALLDGLDWHTESPRYAVTLHYGRRLEPWVVKVEPLETE